MTTFERRQRILELLRDQPGIKVTALAERLDVSEGTIRNDLSALEKEGLLTRVRGGAVLRQSHRFVSPSFAARVRVNAEAKEWIARRAADTVQDGDSILMDASTTVFAMVPHLEGLRNLTVVTNGIETALALARSSHSVILIGGMLRSGGASTVGHLGEKILRDLHIKTAFMSCSGFSVDVGLTEIDIQEEQIKQQMILSAERVSALIDSSKFGKVDLTSFASVDQISHILTDSHLDRRFIDQLRQTDVVLTVCGEQTASRFTPLREQKDHFKIGFANLGESMPFPVDVRRGLEQAAQEASNVDLIVADNQLDGNVALQVADRLIAKRVDLAIEYQIDERAGNLIIDKFNRAGIPVIAVDIPMVGATYFGVDHYRAGHLAGVALGNWIAELWNNSWDRLIVLEEQRPGALVAARIQGQLDGLQEVVGDIPADKIIYLDSGNTTEISQTNMLEALDCLPGEHRLAVISFNDDAAVGALRAVRQLGREETAVIVGQGADRIARMEIRNPSSRLIGSAAYWPEKYGEKLIEVALKILRGEPVPPAVYNEHVFITHENIGKYYPDSRDSMVPEISSTAEER
ncbi:MAG TPA: substrate-binding domain-containing protein [Anaerolineae bacterium]|nr:substrate-binding domain-containing protein [Anaerolineae bacterium]